MCQYTHAIAWVCAQPRSSQFPLNVLWAPVLIAQLPCAMLCFANLHLWLSSEPYPWCNGTTLPAHPESRKCLGVITTTPSLASGCCMSMEALLLCMEVGPALRCNLHSWASCRLRLRLGQRLGLKSHICFASFPALSCFPPLLLAFPGSIPCTQTFISMSAFGISYKSTYMHPGFESAEKPCPLQPRGHT